MTLSDSEIFDDMEHRQLIFLLTIINYYFTSAKDSLNFAPKLKIG